MGYYNVPFLSRITQGCDDVEASLKAHRLPQDMSELVTRWLSDVSSVTESFYTVYYSEGDTLQLLNELSDEAYGSIFNDSVAIRQHFTYLNDELNDQVFEIWQAVENALMTLEQKEDIAE